MSNLGELEPGVAGLRLFFFAGASCQQHFPTGAATAHDVNKLPSHQGSNDTLTHPFASRPQPSCIFLAAPTMVAEAM